MPNYKLTVEFVGTEFSGMQRQDNAMTIQEAIETAIAKFSGENVAIAMAGRTDSGVHAIGQVISFKLNREYPEGEVQNAINFHVKPLPISIVKSEIASDDFHARFNAKSRSYIYKILNRESPSPLLFNRAWHIPRELNLLSMQEGAKLLIGNHDFSSFRASQCQAKSPVKSITSINVIKNGEIIEIHISAPSFLHNQVRIITGLLVEIGLGKKPPEFCKYLIDAKDRTKAPQTAPAHGLYFNEVQY